MQNPHLRYFAADESTDFLGSLVSGSDVSSNPAPRTDPTVTVRVKDVFPRLIEAIRDRRAWLDDFQEDPIVISQDLYEVLLAVDRIKRSAA